MARLSQLCIAALALMVAVTNAAPCGHDHSVQEHHGDEMTHHHQMEHHPDFEQAANEDDMGQDMDQDMDTDCIDECYEEEEVSHHEAPHHTSHHSDPYGNTGGSSISAGGDNDDDDSLVGVKAGYIGTGDVNAQGALTDVVGLQGTHIHDLVQGVDAV